MPHSPTFPRCLAIFLPVVSVVALALPARAEVGVTDTEVLLGQAAAFSGGSAALGVEMWRGASAAFAAANDAGGVHGRKVRLVLADDGYDAQRAAPAVLDLVTRQRVFALFGGVGTPTIVKALPLVLKYHRSEGLFYFANYTGSQVQRDPPYDQLVFNVRASYRQETRAMVDALVAAGMKRIGVFVQDDSFGASGREGVKLALAAHGLKLAADTIYVKGMKYEASAEVHARLLQEAGVEAVIAVGTYAPCAALVRDARAAGLRVPILAVSFAAADPLLALLREEERRTGQPLTTNLFTTQVVPPYTEVALPAVEEYRAAMDRYQPTIPAGIGDGSYQPKSRYSFGSLEGFLSAKAFLAVLQRAGRDLTRAGFVATASKAGALDLGVGAPAEFSASRRQALDRVWLTAARPDGWSVVSAVEGGGR